MEKQVFLIRVQAMAAKENEGKIFYTVNSRMMGACLLGLGSYSFPSIQPLKMNS